MIKIKVPDFKDPDVTKFLNLLIRSINDTDDAMTSTTANASLLLYSPSKKVYSVTVSDAGALTVTKIVG